jgi:6-phosphogluconolactonase
VADLGLDEVLIYRFDVSKGILSRNDPPLMTVPLLLASSWRGVKVNPGAGPRHFAFHPTGKFGYVLNEMDATVVAFSYQRNNGALSFLQTVTTLPNDFSGRNDAAEIAVHPSGKFLYASNRGHESIAIFAIDAAKGTLAPVGGIPTGGKEPRHFAIDPSGKYLLAENQFSNNIVVFKIDPGTGGLTPTGQVVEVPSPVDVAFLRED